MSVENLSPREKECLRHLLREGTIKGVAAVLAISPRTVDAHLASARDKLGLNDSWAAARCVEDFEARGKSPRRSAALAAGPDPVTTDAVPDRQSGPGRISKMPPLWMLICPPIERPPNDLRKDQRRMLMALQASAVILAAAAFFVLLYGVDLFFRHLATQGSLGFHSTATP